LYWLYGFARPDRDPEIPFGLSKEAFGARRPTVSG